MKRWLFLATPLLIVCSLMAAFRFVVQPGLEIWALAQMQSLVAQNTPIEMAASALDLSWIPLKVSITHPRVRVKNGTDLGFERAEAERLEARVDFFTLVSGRLQISSLLVDGLDLNLSLDPFMKGEGSTPEIPWKEIFELGGKIPVSSVALLHNNLVLTSEDAKIAISLNDLNARLLNQTQKLRLEVQTGSSSATWKTSVQHELRWSLGGEITATPQGLEVSSFRLATPSQNLELSGVLTDPQQLLRSPQGRLTGQARLHLAEIQSWLSDYAALPKIEGTVALEASFELKGLHLPQGNFRVDARDVLIGEAQAGSFDTLGHFDGKTLSLPELRWKHLAGEAFARDLHLQLSDSNPLKGLSGKAKISTTRLGLHSLLKGLNVGDLPVDLQIEGDLDCGGPLLPKPNWVCVGQARGRDLLVEVEEKHKKHPLVKLADFSAEGGLQITDEAVSYQARAQVGSDHGTSSGLISYKKGFLIHYETPSVALSHVGSIGGLRVEGRAAIKGSTSGDSDAATFEMDVQGQNLFFENFFLGDTKGQIRYQSGHLFFNDLDGKIQESPYQAHVEVDLLRSRLKVSGESEKLRLEDLLTVFQREFTLPVSLSGRASMGIQLEGPFQLGRLSYTLNAKIPQLQVAGESFHDGQLKIVSVNGEVQTEQTSLRKGSQVIHIRGSGHPNGDVEVDLIGNQLLLEESENITSLGSNISGFLDLGVQIRGFVLNPDVSIQAQLGQMVIEDQEFPPSAAAVELNRKRMEGSVRLFAGRLFGDFTIPFVQDSPFRLKLQASDWSFATLATLIGGGRLLSEYESSMTGDLSLNSEKGGLWAASGEGTITNFLLRRGNLNLHNLQPMRLKMVNGSASLENVHLEGGQQSLKISAAQISREALRLRIDAQLSLRILQLFVPFLEELGGEGRISANVSGQFLKPEILGSAQLTDGFARLRGFPHPLEQASASLQFSASRVLISDIKATLAGGSVTGEGNLLLLGPHNIPVNIRAQANGVTLNIPEKVQTTGDLDLSFTGSWFPYLLAGTYRVSGGLFAKELEEEGTSDTRVHQSSYLPKAILQSAFEPVLLDIQVDLTRPLQLKNSMIEGQATGQIRIVGPPQSPGITGTIHVPSGTKITFRDKIFDVNSATLKFSDPKDLNPELFVSARARVNDYDINLTVQGTAKSPLVRMTSTPPLSQSDIISLLALGVTSQKLEKQIGARQQEQTSTYEVGTAILQNVPLTKTLTKALGVNLQFSSTYDDTKNIAVRKVTLSRRLTDRVNASVSSAQGDQNSTEARVQYFFNPNLSAVGSWENRERTQNNTLSNPDRRSESIFGIDLEFKQEFK